MDAIRIARALHRPRHGAEDLRLLPRPPRHGDGLDRRRVRQDRRPRRAPPRCPTAPASRRRSSTDVFAVHFNDADVDGAAHRRSSTAEGRKPACVIMEAAMMNLGVVLPEAGYLEAVREITAAPRHRPDLRRGQDRPVHRRRRRDRALRRRRPTWSRSPRRSAAACRRARSAATEEVMSVVEDGTVYQVGTYNGNPLGMAAARASLHRGPDARGLRAPRPPQRPHPRAAATRSSSSYSLPGLRGRHRLQGLRHVLADEDRRLRDVQGQPGRRARRPRVAVQHEPRHLHDARPRGGVDAVGDPHRRGRRRATSRCSTRWRRS